MKRTQIKPTQAHEKLMLATKQHAPINMDSTTKRLLARVPKSERPAWKRIMLAAQRHQEVFKQNAALRKVRGADGRPVELVVDTRFVSH